MRKRFAIALLLAAAVWLTEAGRASRCELVPLPTTQEAAKTGSHGRARPAATEVAAPGAIEQGRPATGPTLPVASLDADDAAMVGEVAQLQLMASGTDLALTPAQWSGFAAVSLETQSVRLNYEAQIAARGVATGGSVTLEIPMYAAAGDAMRQRFEARLGETLGVDTAAEILARVGAKLEGHFAGFGVAEQTLEVRGDPRGADCEVTRTASYWNAAEGGAQLASRRETHLPAWEDPSGARWGALLALAGS